jgi:hypothetical protein
MNPKRRPQRSTEARASSVAPALTGRWKWIPSVVVDIERASPAAETRAKPIAASARKAR